MKLLKLILLTIISVISLNTFSQNMVTTTNTSAPGVCDGTAILDTTNVTLTSIYWQGLGAIINQGSYIVTNLCPGTYTVTFTVNGTQTTQTFTITSGNPCNSLLASLTTVNALNSTSCDGQSTIVATGGTPPYTYSWSNGATTATIGNLCENTYICCYVADANGCYYTACDSVYSQSGMAGDTLIITAGGNCNSPIGTLYTQLEDCTIDYNSIDSALLSNVILPTNPLDSTILQWVLIDTLGQYITVNSYLDTTYLIGCYNIQFTLYCSQKSLNIKTIIVNDNWYMGVVGISETDVVNPTAIRFTDLIGRDCKIESGQILIVYYSDGTCKKLFINQ